MVFKEHFQQRFVGRWLKGESDPYSSFQLSIFGTPRHDLCHQDYLWVICVFQRTQSNRFVFLHLTCTRVMQIMPGYPWTKSGFWTTGRRGSVFFTKTWGNSGDHLIRISVLKGRMTIPHIRSLTLAHTWRMGSQVSWVVRITPIFISHKFWIILAIWKGSHVAPGIGEEITITTWLLNHLRYLGSSSTQTRWALKCLTHRFHVWCMYGCALPSQGYLAIFPMTHASQKPLLTLLVIPRQYDPRSLRRTSLKSMELRSSGRRLGFFPQGVWGAAKRWWRFVKVYNLFVCVNLDSSI